MKHLPELQTESARDSVVDVIVNLVGVILILATLVGAWANHDEIKVRRDLPAEQAATNVPQATPLDEGPQEKDLEKARLEAMVARTELEKLATQLVQIRDEAAEFDNNRVALAMHRQVIEEDIEQRRNQLDADKQKEFDVQRQIGEAQIKLDLLTKQQMGLLSGPETVETLESVPTPLARDVEGQSLYLRLKAGQLSVVPINELMSEAASQVNEIRRRLQQQGRAIETFGPLDGYRIQLTILRQADPASVTGPRAGQIERFTTQQYVDILPAADSIGQDVEVALAPGGAVYRYLEEHRRQTPTVLVLLHTDSFKHCAFIKRTLWQMGLSVAMFPIGPNDPLRASLGGSSGGVGISAQ
jgi:hypothetical protein